MTEIKLESLIYKYRIHAIGKNKLGKSVYLRLCLYRIHDKVIVEQCTCSLTAKHLVRRVSKVLTEYRRKGIERGRDRVFAKRV